MKNKSAPRHAKMRAGGSAGGIPDRRLKGQDDRSAAARIIVVALALASLGAGAATLSGHGGAGQASPHQRTGHASRTVSTSPAGTTLVPSVPWML